ncbi:MAG: hypothetical protein WC464_01115 [Bdellovibrionales bacterium]
MTSRHYPFTSGAGFTPNSYTGDPDIKKINVDDEPDSQVTPHHPVSGPNYGGTGSVLPENTRK